MAKKKKKTQQTFMSPDKYVREKVRTLEKGPCYMTHDEGSGMVHIVVSRLHTGGKISAGFYLVDKFCLGVKNSFYKLRMEDYEFDDMIDMLGSKYGMDKLSYDEAHNWIYGAVEFAEEAGIEPCKEFSLTKYFLDEDTDDVPLIEYEFGDEGKHHLFVNSNLEASKYMPLLRKNLGDNFLFTTGQENDGYHNKKNDRFEHRDYTYKHPDYPQKIVLMHPEILKTIDNPDTSVSMTDEQIDTILALPHDSLRQDLESIILYNVGLTCDGVPKKMLEKPFSGVLGNAILLLGEVGNGDSSLDVVLETLRQSPEFLHYHIGDWGHEIYSGTIYKLGKDRLDKLHEFVFEEGIDVFYKVYVVQAVAETNKRQPERHAEIIEWFRSFLNAAAEGPDKTLFTDSALNGLILSTLTHIDSEELLPEIKKLYDIGYVDEEVCGDYDEVADDIRSKIYHGKDRLETDIHKIHKRMKEMYEK